MVEKKQAEMRERIEAVYNSTLKEAYHYVDGLDSYKKIFQILDGIKPNKDTELLELNFQVNKRILEVEQEIDLELEGEDMDLIESKFINDPTK